MQWVEERAETARIALGIEGFPVTADLGRLVEWLQPAVRLWADAPVMQPQLLLRPAGAGAVIAVPRWMRGRELEMALAHEAAHWLLAHGGADYIRTTATLDQRLADRCEAREEAETERFVLAFLLPGWMCRMLHPAEIAEESGQSLALVQRRLEQLPRRVAPLGAIPRWSAAHVLNCKVIGC